MSPRKADAVLYQLELGPLFSHCPHTLRAGNEGVGAFVMCALGSAGSKMPGFIPDAIAGQYGDHIPALLVGTGFWAPHDDGYTMVPLSCWRFAKITRRAAILDALRERIYRRDGYRCVYCGTQDDLTLDHIYPKSLGGPDSEENLQTLCRSCNSSKGARI